MRSGTVPTPLCVGMGAACDLSMKEMEVCCQIIFQSFQIFLVHCSSEKAEFEGEYLFSRYM